MWDKYSVGPQLNTALNRTAALNMKNGAQLGKGKQLSNWGNIRRYVRYYKHLYYYVFCVSSVGKCHGSSGLS